jgi:glycosyltransferase involved in cell wall biosynthesis
VNAVSGASLVEIVVLTRNEDRHLPRLLRTTNGLDGRVFVVDSDSTDSTTELASAAGAFVVSHKFVNQALQFQWALDNLPIDSEWVMRLDADEVLTPELVEEIRRRLPGLPPDVTGVNLKRRHIFLGRWIKHGGRYPLTLLRIWRKGAARIEQRWMDEHMVLLHGRAVTFEHDFSDHNLNDLTFFTDKHNKYATREAIDVLMRRYRLGGGDEALTRGSVSGEAAARRWIKERVYNHLPFWFGSLGYFLYRYFIQLGFLDGREGLVYHVLQGFWYRFLVGAKVLEFDRVLSPLADREARLDALARLTGYARDDLECGGRVVTGEAAAMTSSRSSAFFSRS